MVGWERESVQTEGSQPADCDPYVLKNTNWPLLKLAQRPLIARMLGERGYAALASLCRTLAFSWHSLLGHPQDMLFYF